MNDYQSAKPIYEEKCGRKEKIQENDGWVKLIRPYEAMHGHD